MIEQVFWALLPIEWVRALSYRMGGPRGWAGTVFGVENPIWHAMTMPLEGLAAIRGQASRMAVWCRKVE